MSVINTKQQTIQRDIRTSKRGYQFDVYSDLWMLTKDEKLSLMFLHQSNLPYEIQCGFRLTLARYAEELSAGHTKNMLYTFKHLIESTKTTSIDSTAFINWNSHLQEPQKCYKSALKGFLISWYDYQYDGVDKKFIEYLEQLTLIGNETGAAVANRCPYTGAFTDCESLALINESIRLFKNQSISLEMFAFISALQMTGCRPVALRYAKACDLSRDGHIMTINIPRAKVRYGCFREHFQSIDIIEDLYVLLRNLIEDNRVRVESILKAKLSDNEAELIPLFVDFEMIKHIAVHRDKKKAFIEALTGDSLHITNKKSHKWLSIFSKLQFSKSERTGEYIQVTARRFRYTKGTNLGRQGLGARIIADALGHSNTNNVRVYTEHTVDSFEYLNKAVGSKLAEFASVFTGKVVENLEDGERKDDPSAIIANNDNEAVGACGTLSFCVRGFEACYLCDKFRPWVDGQHEQILAGLYAEKERLLITTKSEILASTKDRIILAVEQVVAECKEIRKGVKDDE